MIRFHALLAAAVASTFLAPESFAAAEFASHPPTRPLPVAGQRPLDETAALRTLYVDAKNGNDQNDGSAAAPWQSLAFAVQQLQPGDVLSLRGGTYYERVTLKSRGTREKPIVIRGTPGELAIIDGGFREFLESPATAWEPCPHGAPGEFQSTKTYPAPDAQAEAVNVMGNFGDSMVPLHGYRFHGDLRSDNPWWNVEEKVGSASFVYCGPGLCFDPATGRIHCRLAHTKLPGLQDDNYRGETDPRKIPLVVAGLQHSGPLTLDTVQHVKLQDLVLRGARTATLEIRSSADVELDGLTVYGAHSPILVRNTAGLRMQHTACRGLAAPWTFRGSLKYRSVESRLFNASGWTPTGRDNRDFEIAFCEFTDSVDGVFIGNVQNVKFHHNLVDNVSDDGIFLTCGTSFDGKTHGGDVTISQNRLSRTLTMFAFGVGHGRQRSVETGKQTGSGVTICRNVFDFRRGVMYHWPTGPDAPQEIGNFGRFASDHGSPAWEPMRIYQNTLIVGEPPRYQYGSDGLSGAMGHGTSRRVFNNIICQLNGMPGEVLPPADTDFQADGNLFWSLSDGPEFTGEFLRKFRASADFSASRQKYPPGWTANDRFADPRFVSFDGDWKTHVDLRLDRESPAIAAGVTIPANWFDPVGRSGSDRPDLGAIPSGAEPWRIGVRGAMNVCGTPVSDASVPRVAPWSIPLEHEIPVSTSGEKPALIVQGYPAFDAPLVEFALRSRGVEVVLREKEWVDPAEFAKYKVVVFDGSFTRAKIEPSQFSQDDFPKIRSFLEAGGVLWLMRERKDLFASIEGRQFLYSLAGGGPPEKTIELGVTKPDHPWVSHLQTDPQFDVSRLAAPSIWRTSEGTHILGTARGSDVLTQVSVGKGQIIYVGWAVASALPNGREKITVAQEKNFEQQLQVLTNIAAELYP